MAHSFRLVLGFAKGLKDRYRELTEQQKRADYVEHRPSGVASKVDKLQAVSATSHRLYQPEVQYHALGVASSSYLVRN